VRFGSIPVDEAEGAILAHSVRQNGLSFKKGRVLSAEDVVGLKKAGRAEVVAARLDADDIPEDEAAAALAEAAHGAGTRVAAPFTGRCNLYAEHRGLAVVDRDRLDRLNLLDEAVTIATVAPFEIVEADQMLATVKIIPFAAPRPAVAKASAIAAESGPLVRVVPFRPRRVGLALTRLPGTKDSVLDKTVQSVGDRLAVFGSEISAEHRVAHEPASIADAVTSLAAQGCDLILVNGASAIVDRRDVVPAGIEAAGGTLDHFGMPVDPGNLLLLAHLGAVPVLGLPGCARSPKLNGFDWVLQRLLADMPVTRRDVMLMGSGGLLKEIATRPQPRQGPAADEPKAKRAPRIAALLLAAGQSRRMGDTNKLLAAVDGVPMVRRAAESLLASTARPVIAVTGHESERVRAALQGLDLVFVDNPDYAQGISASLRHGTAALPHDIDGAVIALGDMPQVTTGHIDRLIAAFDPVEGRSICVPTHHGKRGNPVLWEARFLPEVAAVQGDVGARHLIGEYADLVCEVEMADRGVLLDIDTPEALQAYGAGGTDR